MRGFLGIIFFGIVALTAGALGFQAGVASSVSAGTGGVPAVVYLGGGFNFGGFLFFLLFLGFIRVMPSLSIVEVKEVLPHPMKHAHGGGH